jgi:ubiquinone/menaquinone biosynthesis C-methylase UbiE
MKPSRGFDGLARLYRPLEYLAFGRDLERARFVHLGRLQHCRAILVLGEGDGRCLARLVRAAPWARIDCLDLSPAMLASAARRLDGGEAEARVHFQQADLLTAKFPPAHYDAVVTFFLLDCFTAPQAGRIMRRIQASLQPGALWLWADFHLPARGYPRLRARVWLAVLYGFFRWKTGLPARGLPPVERFFADQGWVALTECSWQLGLVRSVVWQSSPPQPGRNLYHP